MSSQEKVITESGQIRNLEDEKKFYQFLVWECKCITSDSAAHPHCRHLAHVQIKAYENELRKINELLDVQGV